MNKQNKQDCEMSEEVLRERRELIKRMREDSNNFINNIVIHLTEEYEKKLGFSDDEE